MSNSTSSHTKKIRLKHPVQVMTSHRSHACRKLDKTISLSSCINNKNWGYLLSHWLNRYYLVYFCKCICVMEAHILKFIAKFSWSIGQKIWESHSKWARKKNEIGSPQQLNMWIAFCVLWVCLCDWRQFTYYESECQIVYPLIFSFHRIASHIRVCPPVKCMYALHLFCFWPKITYFFWNPFVLISCSIYKNNNHCSGSPHRVQKRAKKTHTHRISSFK